MSLTKKLTWLTVFSIAMGYMETAVVVYLRKIYYPGGFQFPLIPVEPDIALTEFLREAATVIMLLGIGILSGRTASQKFAFFIYCFAIWDIFYYVFLKLLLNWPDSLFTWDILFLIPFPWVGPVLAPCIVSLTMIALTLLILYGSEKGRNTKIRFTEWMFFITGSLIIISSFTTGYLDYLKKENTSIWTLGSKASLFEEIKLFIPAGYNWLLFWLGEFILLGALFLFTKRIFFTYDPTAKKRKPLA